MRGEGLRGREHHVRAIRDEVAPEILPGVVDSCGDHAKRAAARIGADVEDATGGGTRRTGVMVGVVFVIVFARGDDAEVGSGLSGGKEADFAGGVAGGGQKEKTAAARAFGLD